MCIVLISYGRNVGIEPTFRDLKEYPIHSRKGSKASYTTFNQNGNIYIEDDILYLPSAQKSSVKAVDINAAFNLKQYGEY